jgi:hypothetical protein
MMAFFATTTSFLRRANIIRPTALSAWRRAGQTIGPNQRRLPPTFGTNSAARVAKRVAQRPDHEFLFFLSLVQFILCGGGLGSSCLGNVMR